MMNCASPVLQATSGVDNELLSDWHKVVAKQKLLPYYPVLTQFLKQERASQIIYPAARNVCRALEMTPLNSVKVVILGQDPYHGEGQANGLCFSVPKGCPLPPSLKNIYKEISSDLGLSMAGHGDLSPWAQQGVLLLNTVLTVRAGQPQSHQQQGWELFTDALIQAVDEYCPHVVFMLWGKPAQAKQALITSRRHTVLCAAHPSPLSAYRGFLGCRHFSKANLALAQQGQTVIDWAITAY